MPDQVENCSNIVRPDVEFVTNFLSRCINGHTGSYVGHPEGGAVGFDRVNSASRVAGKECENAFLHHLAN